ncbi:5-(carboxyamino)imidazole ribonucleotide synthase [Adhaeribacter soli]|uniref:N5-carboxyaminoimidazole ribonucleotide synthase n=1 Tax=Adhaeribacter soli TaxID=2607655 RepID=A0A5N1IR82_9BACT|nr:5-(carboxyamino)imidazole ribonucleotide synthase [Adhaeribacter soli]KAA9326080.1 5-(carboxyamino)imidazole ribonucleotide synthase [Adhaeribacter soli]
MIGNVKLGILGGGQLGRMLIQAGLDFNLYTLILDPDPDAPCKPICNEFYNGSFADYETVYNFGKKCDVVTIEIEHVNCDALAQLKKEGVTVYPDPEVIRTIQDKGLQKEFYRQNNIPTADFRILKDATELAANSDFLPAFQKLRTLGYDGRGVQKISGEADFSKGFEAPSVLEKLVDYEKEIAVICARNAKGEIAVFPATELVFHPEFNLVDYLMAPANISEELQKTVADLARKVLEAFDMVGLLAVEMFLTKTGEVLVNEVAPRPHNSGHHTMKANYTSQFEQHLRAILNLPLGDTKQHSAAVMVNLLGEPGYSGEAKYEGTDQTLEIPGVFVHLYGKKFTKPSRKMGHMTVLAPTTAEANEKAARARKYLKIIA